MKKQGWITYKKLCYMSRPCFAGPADSSQSAVDLVVTGSFYFCLQLTENFMNPIF